MAQQANGERIFGIKRFPCSLLVVVSETAAISLSAILAVLIVCAPSYTQDNFPVGGVSHPLLRPAAQDPNSVSDSSIIPFSSEMFRDYLPRFSNLDFGFLYLFSGSGLRSNRVWGDFFLPVGETPRSTFLFRNTLPIP